MRTRSAFLFTFSNGVLYLNVLIILKSISSYGVAKWKLRWLYDDDGDAFCVRRSSVEKENWFVSNKRRGQRVRIRNFIKNAWSIDIRHWQSEHYRSVLRVAMFNLRHNSEIQATCTLLFLKFLHVFATFAFICFFCLVWSDFPNFHPFYQWITVDSKSLMCTFVTDAWSFAHQCYCTMLL